MKKTKKDSKIVLTKGKKRGIIWELSGKRLRERTKRTRERRKRREKKSEKV